MSNAMAMMRTGARMVATSATGWTRAMEECGLTLEELNLLTDKRIWTPTQRRQCREALADLTYASLTIAGLPATRVPVEYIAALIAETVNPCNWMVACHRAPAAYRAADVASGTPATEIDTVDSEVLVALVMIYSTEMHRPAQHEINVDDAELAKLAAQ